MKNLEVMRLDSSPGCAIVDRAMQRVARVHARHYEDVCQRIVSDRVRDIEQRVTVNGRVRSFEGNDLAELKRLGVVEPDAAEVV